MAQQPPKGRGQRFHLSRLLPARPQASRVIAQLLVAGATTLLRAGSQAFAKALQSELLGGPAGLRTARITTWLSVQWLPAAAHQPACGRERTANSCTA